MRNVLKTIRLSRIKLLIVVTVMLFSAQIALPATYYLDAINGNDSNPGTSEAPWKTLPKAQSSVSGGDTVIMRNGEYGGWIEYNTAHSDWVTYKAADGHSPELTKIIVENYPPWQDVYLTFDGLTVNRQGQNDSAAIKVRRARHIKFLNLNIIGNGYLLSQNVTDEQAIRLWGVEDCTINNCDIYGDGDSRLAGFTAGIEGSGTDITITNCDISQIQAGIQIKGTNITISHNNIHKIASDGILFYGVNNLTIEYNQLHDLYLHRPTLTETPTDTTWNEDGTVMTNASALWNSAGDNLITRSMEIQVISGTNALIGDGEQHGGNFSVSSVSQDGTQITLSRGIADGGQPSNVNYYIKSVAHTDLLQALAYTDDYDVTIRGNQFYDTEHQIWWINPHNSDNPGDMGGHNFIIENNLCWRSYEDGQDEYKGTVLVSKIDGLVFKNNIVIGRLSIGVNDNVTFLNNIVSYIYVGATADLIKNDYNIINRGMWDTPYSSGGNTIFLNPGYNWDRWNDPAFTGIFADYANGNFQHNSAESLGVGHGDPLNSPPIDLLKRSRDSRPDAGCYEYVSGSVDTSPASTPQDLGATASSQTQIYLSWKSSSDPESGISYYKIYRDDTQIDTTTSTPYSDTGLSSGTPYSYQVSAVNGAGLESARSNAAQATTRSAPSDDTPPTILDVTAHSPVHVLFSESLDQTSAEITANYSISPGITISSATLQEDLRTVFLETSDHQGGIDYTLTVNGVMDVAGNPTSEETQIYRYNDGLVYLKTSASSFNGVDSFVQIPTSGMSAGGGTIALSAYSEDLSGSRYLFGHTVGTWSNRIQLYITDGDLRLGLGGTHSRHAGIATFSTHSWRHVALSWNGTEYAVYVDGLEKATGSYSGLTDLSAIADIGNTGNPSFRDQEAFSGVIDDVFIYDRALNADEILALHKAASKRGRWEFKEYSALSAQDSTNNNNSASLANGPSWTGAGELKLDGIDDYVDCGSGASSNLTGDLTVTAWVCPDSFGGNGLGRIIDKGGTDSGFAFYVRESTRSIAYLVYGGDFVGSDTDIIDLAQWQHVAVTYTDTSDTVAFYVNGQPAGGGNYQTNPNDSANAPLIIGNRTALDRGFEGMLSDVRLYSRALADDEISAIYRTYEVIEAKNLSFEVSATDGSVLSYVIQDRATLPAGATFTDSIFTWRPWYDQAGSYEITFEVPGQPDLTQSVPMAVENVTPTPWYQSWLKEINKY